MRYAKKAPVQAAAARGGAGALVGSAVGAGIGTTVALLLQAGINVWQLQRINGALREHNVASNFTDLSEGQAMLILAAYKINLPMLKDLIERETAFVSAPGTWNALADLAGTSVEGLQKEIATQRVNRPSVMRQISTRIQSARKHLKSAAQRAADAL